MLIRSDFQIPLLVALCVVVIDQLSKWAVMSWIPVWSGFPVTDFFNLVHIRNSGAAFGILSDPKYEWSFWFFLAATVLALGFVVYLVRTWKTKPLFAHVSLGLICGGAVGNLIDRLRFRSVVDFLDFHVGGWHWPAFNVADMAICGGAFVLCWLLWRLPEQQ